MSTKIIKVENADVIACVFGSCDANIKIVEKAFSVRINNRICESGEDAISVSGEDDGNVKLAADAVSYLVKMSKYNENITDSSVMYVVETVKNGEGSSLDELSDDTICVTMKGKPIKAKTVGQKMYVNAIKKNTIVIGTGPAGTGKTFLAVAMAVKALREKQVSRIILTRPAIEAGEKLGFLPGDLQSKIDPYLRPLYDSLYEMMGAENYQRQVEKGVIEVAPLAYMRGRTLDDSFIILDEAQNCTPEQMKMFLTRLGFNSKAVVTGDLTQTDLPYGQKSGLAAAVKILADIDDIAIHSFTERDVVRHKLVQQIILAYEKYEKSLVQRHEQGKKENHRAYSERKNEK